MARTASAFKPARVTRFLLAVGRAGLQVQRVEIDKDKITAIVTAGEATSASAPLDDLDLELAEFTARHGQD